MDRNYCWGLPNGRSIWFFLPPIVEKIKKVISNKKIVKQAAHIASAMAKFIHDPSYQIAPANKTKA